MKLLLIAVASSSLFGQAATYRLDFEVRDSVSKEPQRFSLVSQADSVVRLRNGSKVPYLSGEKQYNYAEIGTNLDCRLRDAESSAGIRLSCNIELSTVDTQSARSGTQLPIIHQSKSEISAIVPPGKQALLTSIDEPVSQRKLQILVTVRKD